MSGASRETLEDLSAISPDTDLHRSSDGRSEAARLAARRIAATIGDIVTVLSRDPKYQNMPLKDLHDKVFPAVTLQQCAVAYSTANELGIQQPVAVVLWAMVSEHVEKRLLDFDSQLPSSYWNSGPKRYIFAFGGNSEAAFYILQSIRNEDDRLSATVKAESSTGSGKQEFVA